MPAYPRCFAGNGLVTWVVRTPGTVPEVWLASSIDAFETFVGPSAQWDEVSLVHERVERLGLVPPSPPVTPTMQPIVRQPVPQVVMTEPTAEPESIVVLPEPRRRHVDLTNNG
jgi:hypothetical protein